MKKLAIDCRSINKEKTGVGNVLYNIIGRLDLLNVEVTLFFDRYLGKSEYDEFISKGYNIEVIENSNYVLWEQVLFPLKIKSEFDYVWFPANTGSVFIKAKKIATIHDVIFDKSINEIPLSGILKKDLARLYRKIFAKLLAKTAKKIYTVSNYSKDDIVNSYDIDKDKIEVVYNGLSSKYINIISNENILKENYILSFGSTEPRKNTELMIKVYKYLIEHYKDMKETKLILYGFRDYDKSQIKKLINIYSISNKVIIYGYVSDDELITLYRKAKIFCFLSSFEGFGLPIIESMACKTPVVALANSSISEIIQDSGILIKNNSIENISEEIYKLFTNSILYNEMVRRGIKNIKRFNWDISATKISKDIEELTNENR